MTTEIMTYHIPVLLKESISALEIDPKGVYVDLTFGGGGHSMAILEQIKEGKLYAFDQDPDAAENANRFISKSFEFIQANFRNMDKFLQVHGVKKVDGILADLGVSSHQINEPSRGFSTRFQGKLDMRMDKASTKNARKIINSRSEEDLHQIFGMYGEIKNARTLANAIVQARDIKQIETIDDLKEVVTPLAPRGQDFKYLAKVFQALRIEVNDELNAVRDMLTKSVDMLKPGGRLVVISYHSLEDRLVKNFLNKGKFHGELEKDVYGNDIRPFTPALRKPVVPSESEIEANNRARSAKMRVGIKN